MSRTQARLVLAQTETTAEHAQAMHELKTETEDLRHIAAENRTRQLMSEEAQQAIRLSLADAELQLQQCATDMLRLEAEKVGIV
jgi:hypothetical protein